MGRGRTPGTSQATILKPGFTLAQHRELGETLGAMQQTALGVRQLIREHVGSATQEYGTATRVSRAIQDLQTVLLHEAVPLDELRAIYAHGRASNAAHPRQRGRDRGERRRLRPGHQPALWGRGVDRRPPQQYDGDLPGRLE